jgi:hypothetical protein
MEHDQRLIMRSDAEIVIEIAIATNTADETVR